MARLQQGFVTRDDSHKARSRKLSLLTVPTNEAEELALSAFNRRRRPLTPRTHQPQLAASLPTALFRAALSACSSLASRQTAQRAPGIANSDFPQFRQTNSSGKAQTCGFARPSVLQRGWHRAGIGRLMLARKIVTIVLIVWKDGSVLRPRIR